MGGVKHDYLTVADTKPQASEVDRDEIVINEADGSMWSKNQSDVVIKLGGSSGGSGHVIQDDGTPMVNRANLNLVGFTVEDDAGNDATKITNTSIARPILTGPASEFMGQAIVITVTNWFTGYTYDWTNLDSVVDNDDGTFSGVLPDVVEDDVAWTITAVAKQDGLLPSPVGTHTMENKLQVYTEALELDINQSNINDTSFPTRDGIVTTGGELTGTTNGGTAVSSDITDGSTVIKKADNGAVVIHHSEHEFPSISSVDSTTDTLVTLIPIADGDNLVVVKDDLSVAPYDNISGTIETNTVALLDVLGDGSCLHAFNFDGDASSIDNTTTASTIGTPTYSSGTFGQKIELLDGSTTAVDTGISSPSGSFAISGYFTWEADAGGNACVSSNNNANSYTRGFTFGFHTTAGLFVIVGNGGSQTGSAQDVSSLITVGNTYFLRFEYDETEARLYADGTLMASATYSGMTSGHSNMFIARQADNYTNRHGSISVDQLRFFNKTLTSNEDSFIGKELYYTYTLDPTISEVPSRVFAVDNKVEYKMDDGTGYQEATRLVDTNTIFAPNNIDPFGDGSLKFSCEFEGNLTENLGTSTVQASGGTETYSIGKFDRAVSGIGQSVYLNSNDAVIPCGTSTASFWLKYAGTTVVNNNGIFAWGSISDNAVCSFAIGGSFTSKIWVGLEAGYLEADGATITNDDAWHHILVERDGAASTTSVELDGVVVAATWVNSGAFPIFDGTRIGAGASNVTPGIPLEVDQAQVFNRLLTSDEKKDLRTLGNLRVNRTHNPVVDATGSVTLNTRVTAKAIGNKIKAVNAALFE